MRAALIIAILVLLGAIVLQLVPVRDVSEGDRASDARPVGLAQRIPRELPGWVGGDAPLGANEVASTAVQRTLNYDDYIYRVFRRGDTTLGIYIAYWAPGRMPIQKVASHTPDRCWTENGWRCLEMKHGVSVAGRGVDLQPAQWRLFEPPSTGQSSKEHVLFWHLVGDRIYDYGTRSNATPRAIDWWRDTVAYATSGSDAQYFIRVTSNRPFDELREEPAWQAVVASLGALGLAAAGSPSPDR
jgi:hypothetical protein